MLTRPSSSIQQPPRIMHDLTGKVVLITGLGQSQGDGWGIGAATAVLLARQGAMIFGGNRTVASTLWTQDTIRSEGGSCDVVACDVTDSTSVKALVDACMQKHGKIDILVNNVGRSEPGCPAAMSEDVWDSQMDINLKSVYLLCHHVLPVMESQGSGAVASISSIAGLRYIGKPQVAYSATKAAVMQFMKATAIIYAPKGVRLNTVVPGLMETPYTQTLATKYGGAGADQESYLRKRDAQVPMGKMGDAWDVANTVLFLVSDEARYITGQNIVVDGGITSSTGRV
ncbi:NAD(P)-binding protein [Aureobasidium pullulans]|nr:NAD(P)-binding protein [Aureobasidium pullulans]THZ31521.1 NAD(P)-binding protein [Aureobasidium pullulans]